MGECLPYISQRLLSDPDPRTGNALRTFVFGKDKDRADRVVDTERLELLVQGFSSYTKAATGADVASVNSLPTLTLEQLEVYVERILDIILTTNAGRKTPLQQLLVDEISRLLGAVGRQGWAVLRRRSGVLPSGRSLLGLLVDPLGIFQSSPLVLKDEVDDKILESALRLINLFRRIAGETTEIRLSKRSSVETESGFAQVGAEDMRAFVRRLVSKLWMRRRDISVIGSGVLSELLVQVVRRIEATPISSSSRPRLPASSSSSSSTVLPIRALSIAPSAENEAIDGKMEKEIP